jgi:hypothetical protein
VKGWTAFRAGLSHTLRYRQVLLLLFGVNLLSALLLAAVPAAGLAAGLGHRPAIRQAADGVEAWLVIETLASPLIDAALGQERTGPRGLQQATLVGLVTAAALPLLAWLSGAFLSGGMLLTFAEAPRPFRWPRFLWGCCHWFGPFLLLGAVQAIASTVLFVPLVGAAVGAVAAGGGWLAWVVVPLLAAVAALWLAVTECTRIAAVVGRTRNVFRAFGRAVGFLLRSLPAVGGLYGPALALLGLLHALYRWGLMAHLPLDWWPLVLVVQQSFVLARLGARLTRLAGGVVLVRELVGW